MWKPCSFVLFHFSAISHKAWGEHLKLCHGAILLKCFRLEPWRTVRELCWHPLPAPVRLRPWFLEEPQKASEALRFQLREAALHNKALKQTLQTSDDPNSNKSHPWFPNEEPEFALSSPWSRRSLSTRSHNSPSYPWQTFGSHPNVVSIFAAKQLWGIMLCLFSLTPPQWAYIFVFPCLHTCSVPRGGYTDYP